MSSKTTADPEALRGAISLIENHSRLNAEALVELLKQRGLKTRRRFTDDGRGKIWLFGIEAEGRGVFDALELWARKARRALARGA